MKTVLARKSKDGLYSVKHHAARGATSNGVYTYSGLRRKVKEALLLGKRRIERALIESHLETGRLIHRHLALRRATEGSRYGKQVIQHLARDLRVGDDLLYRVLRVYRAFPISAVRRKFTWTHLRDLIRVSDPKKRLALARMVEEKGWTTEVLQTRIRQEKKKSRKWVARPIKAKDLLIPNKGTIGLYQIKEDGEGLNLDLGFTTYRCLEKKESRSFKADDLVTFDSRGKMIKKAGAKSAQLYAYRSESIRWPDADTPWMKIWIKPPYWVRQKLRLRGIDAPERKTPEGKQAKRFVERLVKKARSITITTTKPDKWDRYLSDVFLKMPDGAEIFLNNELLKHGHACRYRRVRLEDWD